MLYFMVAKLMYFLKTPSELSVFSTLIAFYDLASSHTYFPERYAFRFIFPLKVRWMLSTCSYWVGIL